MSARIAERPVETSRRATAKRGMVATAHPLASEAGRDVLASGGNAVDAAIAAAAVLGVVQPMMSGLGGDSFVLIRSGATGDIRSINASGPSPAAQTMAWAADRGLSRLPDRGILSASVPGAVDAMCVAHAQFGSGRLSLSELLQPAIRHAAEGITLSKAVGRFFDQNSALLAAPGSACRVYRNDDGTALTEGQLLRQPELARTLQAVANGGADSFYRGDFARRLVQHSIARGGLFTLEDVANFHCEVLLPLATRIGGKTVYTNPPVGQGVVLLEALGILERYRARREGADPSASAHAMIEALKLAFADRNRHVGDPRFVSNPIERLLGDAHLRAVAGRIDPAHASDDVGEHHVPFGDGDTTCLTTADEQGNTVAYITSLSTPFGSAEVVEGTGVLMNNRAGRGFTLDPSAPNRLEGGKRTMSTLHVYMVCGTDGVELAGGTSGGDGQPQWNLQILDAVMHRGMDIHDAIEQPRWELSPGTDPVNLGEPFELRVDRRIDPSIVSQLGARGHRISDKPLGMLGAAQMIAHRDGAWIGAADSRADGCALGLD